MLSRVTRLLALVSAPPLETTTVRRVEVLLLQPDVVMIVVITSTGGVTKRVATFERPVDPGLATWAGEYLNDRVAGLTLGSSALRQRLADPGLTAQEREFLGALSTAFTSAADDERRLYVGGAAGLLDDVREDEFASYRRLLEILEQRAALLELLRGSLDARRPFVRVGAELEHPELCERRARRRRVRARAPDARHGQPASARCAWTTTRRSAPSSPRRPRSRASSKTSTKRPDERERRRLRRPALLNLGRGDDRARLLRAAGRPARRERAGHQERVPQARARAAPGRLRGARRGGAVPRGRRGVPGAVELGDARALRPLRPRRPARAAASRPASFDFGNLSDIFSAFFGDDLFGMGGRTRRARGADIAAEVEIELAEAARGVTRDVPFQVSVTCDRCNGNGAEPGTTPVTCPTCGGGGRVQQVSRSVFGEFVRDVGVPAVRRLRHLVTTPCTECDGSRPEDRGAAARRDDSRRHPRRPADPDQRRGPRGRSSAAARATSTSACASGRTRDSCATATTSSRPFT